MSDILPLLLGWLLGTLTPGIAEAIRRPKRKAELARVLRTDFDELRYKTALVAHQMRARAGTMDAASLALVKRVFDEYSGTEADADFKTSFGKLLEVGEKTYIALQNAVKGKGSPYPVKYELPFLGAHLHDIETFDVATQAAILRARGELHLFNEQVAQIRIFHDRTFSTLSSENYAANSGNYESSVEQMVHRAEALIRALASAIDSLQPLAR